MNSQPSNHTTESKDVGSSSSNSSGNNNLPQKKILSDSKFQHMAGIINLEIVMIKFEYLFYDLTVMMIGRAIWCLKPSRS